MKTLFKSSLLFGFAAVTFVGCSTFFGQRDIATEVANATPWKITKTEWSEADERNYSNFVAALGNTNCGSFDSCIRNAANPYKNSDSTGIRFYSDCADLPYMLRSYFAWKNGLPFSIVSDVATANGANNDIRYSPQGNVVRARTNFITRTGPTFPNPYASFQGIVDTISSAMFRYHPEQADDSADVSGERLARLVPDFYPARIDREGVRPGTVIYDPNGHVAVVYKVEDDGRVQFIDSHPDNSLTRGTYGKKFARSSPGMGAGFKNFRPLKLVGATRNADGNYVGGQIYFLPNNRIPGYDVTQFFGTVRDATSWRRGTFPVDGQNLDYYDWVRTKLASGNLRFHPVAEVTNMVNALCQDLRDRVTAVDASVTAGIIRQEHPATLPRNIYGTDGDWESFSSPSRDARLKTSFKELRDQTQSMVDRFNARDQRIDYTGTDLKGDLVRAYTAAAEACIIEYTKSNGAKERLNLEQISKRLFLLSFDPYHCTELRWGASSAAELASCGDNQNKRDWYAAEQRLRNQIERVYDVRMDFDIAGLNAKRPGSGVDTPPDVDVLGYLRTGTRTGTQPR